MKFLCLQNAMSFSPESQTQWFSSTWSSLHSQYFTKRVYLFLFGTRSIASLDDVGNPTRSASVLARDVFSLSLGLITLPYKARSSNSTVQVAWMLANLISNSFQISSDFMIFKIAGTYWWWHQQSPIQHARFCSCLSPSSISPTPAAKWKCQAELQKRADYAKTVLGAVSLWVWGACCRFCQLSLTNHSNPKVKDFIQAESDGAPVNNLAKIGLVMSEANILLINRPTAYPLKCLRFIHQEMDFSKEEDLWLPFIHNFGVRVMDVHRNNLG